MAHKLTAQALRGGNQYYNSGVAIRDGAASCCHSSNTGNCLKFIANLLRGKNAMNTLISMANIGLIAAASATFAQDETSMPRDLSKMRGIDSSTMTKHAQLDIAPAAADAVATDDRFNGALSAGELDKAGAELDANVLVLENGGAELTAAEYLGGHAKGDAAFLKTAQVQLIRRTARADRDMAWVGSESELHSTKHGRLVTMLSLETMVLRRTNETWKIVHIHWSSQTKRRGTSR